MKKTLLALALVGALGLGIIGTDVSQANNNSVKEEVDNIQVTPIVKGKFGEFTTIKADENEYALTDGVIEVKLSNARLGRVDFEEASPSLPELSGKETVLTAVVEISNVSEDSALYQPEDIKLIVNGKEYYNIWLISSQNGIYSEGDTHLADVAWILDEDVEDIDRATIDLAGSFVGPAGTAQVDLTLN